MRIALLLGLITCFQVALASPPQDPLLDLHDARHLANRSGFGASPAELVKLIGVSRSQAINIITRDLASDLTNPMPAWTRQSAPHHSIRNELSKVARRKFNEARDREILQLRQWWIREMIETRTPQTERLVLFWHSHFATGYSAINDQAISIARQHRTLRKHAAGNFRDFLKAMIRDPALLNYLDNDNSRKSQPNENLARELLELFTLGEGNYREDDIKNTARALTGYSYHRYSNLLFNFNPARHDNDIKTVFGHSGKFDGDDVIDLILQQPAAARFIARKFWHFLVSHNAPTKAQIEHLAIRFRESNYEIRALYRAVLSSDAFWDQANRHSLIRSPVSLTIGTIRSTGIVPVNWQTLATELKTLGQNLFDPPNVAGWPGAGAWVTPGRLLNRLEWLKAFNQSCESCADTTMTPGAMKNGSTMATENAMINPAGATMTDTLQSTALIVTMASEEADVAVQYQITLLADDTILWTSGRRKLPGGRNTKMLGRAKRLKNLPWREVQFALPKHAHRFDTIEIAYLNDKQFPGADSNLYIDRVQFQRRVYDANAARQINQCPKKKAANKGALLCNGKVILNKPSSVASAATDPFKTNQLTASGVYLHHVRSRDHAKRPGITFLITDATLDSRHWHTLMPTIIYIQKADQYKLHFDHNSCWPDCFEQWPQCGKQVAKKQRWSLTINPDFTSQCAYKNLGHKDKKFISTLIALTPELYTASKATKKINKPETFQDYAAWAPHMANIANRTQPMSMHTTDQKLLNIQSIGQQPIMTTTFPRRPGAGSQTRAQFISSIEQLQLIVDLAGPGQYLLGNEQSETPRSLQDTLSDLSYQLH